jgi:hypothetical protein
VTQSHSEAQQAGTGSSVPAGLRLAYHHSGQQGPGHSESLAKGIQVSFKLKLAAQMPWPGSGCGAGHCESLVQAVSLCESVSLCQ